MSQIEELLRGLSEEDIATYSKDPTIEEHIIITADRQVFVPEALKNIAVQFDHNVETVAFDCPRYWDGLDMSTMSVHINYMRPDGIPGTTPALHVATDENNPDIMHFNWVIKKHATTVHGTLRFLVCIKKVAEDGTEQNHWNSELNSEMHISEGLECTGTPLDQNPDVVTYLLTRLNEITETCINQYLNDHPLQLDETLTDEHKAAHAAATGVALAELATEIDDFKREVTGNMDTFYSEAGYVRQHVWRRWAYSPESYSYATGGLYAGSNSIFNKDGYLLMASGADQGTSFSTTVYYTDTLEVNTATGAFIPGVISKMTVTDGNYSNLATLRGKYWSTNKEALTSTTGVVYLSGLNAQYVEETHAVEYDGISEDVRYIFFECPTIITRIHTPEIVGDPELYYTDTETINKVAGYRYEYLGLYRNLPTRMAFSEKINYTGNGTLGVNNPVNLKFDGIPFMVLLSSGSGGFRSMMILVYGQREGLWFPWTGENFEPGRLPIATWTNNVGGGCTLSIYVATKTWNGSSNQAWQQFNEAGVHYTAIAIY